jgi:arginyl-tRNA synthetase
MINKIKQQIINTIEAEQDIKLEVPIKKPPQEEFGDLSLPCFQPAQKQDQDPKEFAKKLVHLNYNQPERYFSKIESKGPFLNFHLNNKKVAQELVKGLNKKGKELFSDENKGKQLMIEYPSPNTHKNIHVGHLRNVCIGNCLRELYTTKGYEVIPVNYINDLGAHVAKSIWGIMNLKDGDIPRGVEQEFFADIYQKVSQKAKENERIREEIEEIKQKIENKQEEIWEMLKKTKNLSLSSIRKILKELDVYHHQTYFESDLIERGQKIIDELLEYGIAEEGEKGAIIVDLEKYHLDTAIVRKSDGAGLYITGDLALAEKKFETYPNIDESIYITGNEQQHHFQQLFKILELYGFNKKMTHIGYGLISLKSGKMSSREGDVITYNELKTRVYKKLEQETASRHKDWTEEKISNVAEKLTLAVLKFDLQKHESKKNITFDIEEATNFNGYSAPYVLYVYARINSLKEESIPNPSPELDLSQLNHSLAEKLIIKMIRLEEVIDTAFDNYDPAKITKYCFELAQLFNDYYSHCQIIQDSDLKKTKARLKLADCVQTTLEKALDLLTIEPIEEM